MRRLILPLLAGLCMAGPVSASIMVVGSSPGRSCYEAARAKLATAGALTTCDEALASDLLSHHDLVASHVNRGIVKMWGNDYDGAVADFDRAIALDAGQAESYLNKGSTLLRMKGSSATAVALYSEALNRGTKFPALAHYGRAIAHEVSGDVRAAYRDYRRAQELAPRWDEPKRELARFTVVNRSSL